MRLHEYPPDAEESPSTWHFTSQQKERIDPEIHRQIDAMNQAGTRIQELIEQIDASLDPAARALFQRCMESVLDFYGHGLKRVLQIAADAGPEERKVYNAIVDDPVLRGLLLIHDLHPADQETRLRKALDGVRPYLKSHGGNVELISLKEDVARLRLQGTCKSCASSAVTLELAIKHAIEEACPDLSGFEVEGVLDVTGQNGIDAHPNPVATNWIAIDGAQQLDTEAGLAVRVGGLRLIVLRASDNFYAYRDHCPACNMPLDPNSLSQGTIRCGLGHKYSLREAGRSVDSLNSHLDPVPLLVQEQVVKVAVPMQADDRSPG
jgi:Fe-S cluster biogenesis protein NfuA/nitrite reductase/ring-hydroxylating ferredoxin subunit